MSALDSLLDHLRNAYAAISETEEVARRIPGDRYVLANLDALKRDVSDLEIQWEEECRNSHVEICRYRLLPEHSVRYTVPAVTKSLLDFQELFTQIYDALKGGAKQRGKVSKVIQNETAFDFGFSYPGSLGVALTVPSSASLFEGKFDDSVEAFLQILNVRDQDEVKDIAKALGRPVVMKAYDWSFINFSAGYGVDVTWNNVRGTKRGGIIGADSLGKIAEIIGRTSDTERREYETRGTLVGIDALKKRFRLVEPDGTDYAGMLSEEFPLTQKWAINTAYVALIVDEQRTEYATDETKTTFRLKKLTPVAKEIDRNA